MVLPDPFVFDHLVPLPGLVHGVFSRAGGNSSGPFSGLNIGMSCGDDPEIVSANRSRMLAALGLSNAVFLNQVHGDDILVLKKGMDIRDVLWNSQAGKTLRPALADAVVTDIEEIALVIQVADCQAVILYDPVNRVIANVHSGWRGSMANILGQCVNRMALEFQCRPENILAGISPPWGPAVQNSSITKPRFPNCFGNTGWKTGLILISGKCPKTSSLKKEWNRIISGRWVSAQNVMWICSFPTGQTGQPAGSERLSGL